jgi:hypothetical protein
VLLLATAAALALLAGACGGPAAPVGSAAADATVAAPSAPPGPGGGSSTVASSSAPSSTTTTKVVPPAALTAVAYDNALATRACTLLAPTEIQAQFGALVAPGVPIDPYCWWKVGDNGFVSLTVFDKKPISTFRAYSGLPVGDVADVGESAFFASNKTLFVGLRGSTYVVQFERGAEWVDTNRPKLINLALLVMDRLGYVPPPKPPPTTKPPAPTTTNPDAPPPPSTTTTKPPPTTTTTRPTPPAVPVPVVSPRPTGPIDVGRAVTPEAPLRIWVGGDSIAGGPAWALGEAAHATGAATADTEFQVGTGLSRPDFFDWYRHLAAVADARDPEVMVLLFGGNDIQPLDLPGGGQVAYGDPRWLPEYRRRVAQIMDAIAVRGRRVIWVGTPPMEDAEFNTKMAALNEIYSSEATAHGPWVTYFDAWTMFSAPGQPGVFARELPGADGAPQRVRFDDIHYDVHGSELLAAALMTQIRTFSKVP